MTPAIQKKLIDGLGRIHVDDTEIQNILARAKSEIAKDGLNAFARKLEFGASNFLKIVAGKRKISRLLKGKLEAYFRNIEVL